MDDEKVLNCISQSRAGVRFFEPTDESIIFETYKRRGMKGVGLVYSTENHAELKMKKDRTLLFFRGEVCDSADEAAEKTNNSFLQDLKLLNGKFLAPQRSGAWLVEHCNSFSEANVEIVIGKQVAMLKQKKTLKPGDVLRYPYADRGTATYIQIQTEIKMQQPFERLYTLDKKRKDELDKMMKINGYLFNSKKRFASISTVRNNDTRFSTTRQPERA